jgi:protein kinase A
VLSTESFGELLERAKHGLARELTHRRWYLQNRNAVKWTDLEVIETIGQGAFGRVKIAQHSSTGNTYALKCMKKMLVVQGGQLDNVASECGLLETSLHPFILRMHAAYQDETQLYMLLEIILGGELYTLLQASKKFAVGQASFYTACVVAAIGYLNSMDIVYRDIKPENLLLDAEGYVKVVDFGFAKVIDKRSYSFCGTPEYMPPEIMMCKPHHLPCDWWSIGILVFEMLTGGSPFDTDSEEPYAIYENVICFANTGEPPIPYPWLFNWKAKDFVNKLLVGEPDERLDTGAMLKHDFLSDIDVLKLEKRELEPPYVPTIKDPLDTSNFDTDALDDSDSEDEDSDGIQRIDNKKKGKLLDRCRKPKTFSVFEPVDAEHWIA